MMMMMMIHSKCIGTSKEEQYQRRAVSREEETLVP